MSSIDAKSLLNLLRSQTFTTLVDQSLTNVVDDKYKRRIGRIESELVRLGAVEDLKLSHSFLANLQNDFIEVLVEAEGELNSTQDSRISSDQAKVLEQLMAIQFLLQSKQTLLTDSGIINDLYSRMLNLSITKELGQFQLDALLRSDESGGASFGPSVQRYTETKFSQIQGIDAVRDRIRNIISREFITEEYTLIMLTGPPGTGKSTLSQAIATVHSGGAYYNLNIGELSSPNIGVTERGLRDLFEKLESNPEPATLILDEVDNIFSANLSQPHLQSVKITLQTEISGSRKLRKNVVIIGITNHYDRIEDVIKRRASSVVYVPLPRKETQIDFLLDELKVKTAEVSQTWRTSLIAMIAEKNYTNANIKFLVRNAKIDFFETNGNRQFSVITTDNVKTIVTSNFITPDAATAQTETEDVIRDFVRQSENNRIRVVPSVENFRNVSKNVFSLTDAALADSEKRNNPDAIGFTG